MMVMCHDTYTIHITITYTIHITITNTLNGSPFQYIYNGYDQINYSNELLWKHSIHIASTNIAST